jgi:hypothetical protein
MRRLTLRLFSVLAVAAAVAALAASSLSRVAQTPSPSSTQAVVVAADAFLKTLGAELRGKVQFPFVPQKSSTSCSCRPMA